MTELGQPQITLKLAHVPEEAAGSLMYLFEEQNLGTVLVTQILSMLPNPQTWRLTITGDMVKTVNEIEARGADDTYTMDRGAGHVGARTMTHEDGTSDIVISTDVFTPPEGAETPEEVVKHAVTAAAHIALHEAGHAALSLRGEDWTVYQDLPQLEPTPYAWRKHLATHVDDNRIEQHTSRVAPSPLSQTDHLSDAIAHFREELNHSKSTWAADIAEACYRTLTAANNLIRVIAYLAAELGLDERSDPVRPEVLPESWNEYIEDSWNEWSRAFHKLEPADQPMRPEQIAEVLGELCQLADSWLRSIGVDYRMTSGHEQFIYWSKDRY